MLSTLANLKSRLAIPDLDVQHDDLLTTALTALSSAFDKYTNRTLARTANTTHEFAGNDTEILPPVYPIESVSKFELKTSESEGWIEQTNITYLVRNSSVISLASPFCILNSAFCIARVTLTGGFVLPGDTASAGQTPLPPDLEQAAIEQVAYWFRNRDKIGLIRNWPHQGTYEQFTETDLLPTVLAILRKYERWAI